MRRRSPRSLALAAARYGLALAALAWVATQVRLPAVLDLLGRLDAATIAGLLAVTVVGLLGRFDTWRVVIGEVRSVSLRTAAETDLVVNFVNQLLPSRLSGRVAAPFVLRSKTGMAYTDAVAVSGVHTGVYAVLYGLTAAVGLGLAVTRLSAGVALLLALSTGLYVASGAAVLLAGANLTVLDRVLGWVAGLCRRLPRVGAALADRVESLFEFTASVAAAFRRLGATPGLWARYAVGWTLALVVAPGVRVLLLFGAFGVAFEPAVLLPLYLVAAYSVTLLPLTPGGIGVTEATATVVFVALGVPSEVVVPVILIDRFLGVYLPALGGWYPSLGIDRADLTSGE